MPSFKPLVCVLPLIVAVGACTSSNTPLQPTTTTGTTGTTTTTTTATPTTPTIVINAPTPVLPVNGATASGWPTFTVNDAVRAGPVGLLVYRFDVSTSAAFSPITVTGTVSETPNQTSFTPPSSQAPPPQGALFWRAIAIDAFNVVSSPLSAVQIFTYMAPPSAAATLAAQEGSVLWPGAQPSGSSGHAILGNLWNVQLLRSYDGVTFMSPELEEIRIFDLLDRGFDPQGAIDWMHSNGYPTIAAYYGSVAVIGFTHEYMALINGQWDLVLKAGA
jgi:hypothetical protein